MKLDVDLIRDILFWCEENTPEKGAENTTKIEIGEYSNLEITTHFALLIEAGYIKANNTSGGSSERYMIERLTFDGYQYLEAIKSNTLWKKYKEAAGKVGIEAVRFALPVLADYVKHQLGLP